MKPLRRQFLGLAAAAAALPAVSRFAQAQTYPSRPIRLVIPFAPGGATDVVGHLYADRIKPLKLRPLLQHRRGQVWLELAEEWPSRAKENSRR
jgi:hypothetical protein